MDTNIVITEQNLKNIIRECIYEKLNNSSKSIKEIIDYSLFSHSILNEMALHKKEFEKHIYNLKDQLVENWCLCAFCSLYDKTNPNFSHWKVEFASYSNKIKRVSLKAGSKYKIIHNIYIEKFDLNQPKMIGMIFKEKFIDEQLQDNDVFNNICNVCAQNAEKLVKFLADDEFLTKDYISLTFEN